MPRKRIRTAIALTAAVSTGILLLQVHRLTAADRLTPDGSGGGGDDLTLANIQNTPASGTAAIARNTTIEFLEHTARTDSYIIIRHEAVLALGRLGEPSVPVLQSLLRDQHWLVRTEAAIQLGELGATNTLPQLIEVMQNDNDPWVKYKAGEALTRFGDDALPYVQEHLLYSAVAEQRVLGFRLLSGMQSPVARTAALRLFTDENNAVRRAAAEQAPAWADREIANALLPLLNDRDRQVRTAAERSLVRLAEFARPKARELATSVDRDERVRGYNLLALVGNDDDLAFFDECRALEATRQLRNTVNRAQRNLRQSLRDRAGATAAAADPAAAIVSQLPNLENEYVIAVDCNSNKLYLVRGGRVLRECVIATGMDRRVSSYYFHTPRGEFSILSKERDPLWYRPAWAWIERGQAVPTGRERWRGIPGVMGKAKLDLGHGYAIHGTNDVASLGSKATHGCIRVGAVDLEAVYNIADVGTRVFIF